MSTAEDTAEALPIPQRFLDKAARPETEAQLRKRLPKKLRGLADSRIVGLAKEAYGYATHPAVSRRTKLLGAGALLYFIAPFDAVSDFIPGLGYVDDAAVLTAFVMSVREGTKQVVSHVQLAAEEVVSHAVSEAREAWARRGVSQVCLSLWATTLAACVGLLYTGARTTLIDAPSGTIPQDPFFWACIAVGAFGLIHQLVFGFQVWKRYAAARPDVKEALAYAIVSLADWKQAVALALPVILLAALLAFRVALAGQG
jgi:uncharacterized membrane protein YkvA (DUF1232 family)